MADSGESLSSQGRLAADNPQGVDGLEQLREIIVISHTLRSTRPCGTVVDLTASPRSGTATTKLSHVRMGGQFLVRRQKQPAAKTWSKQTGGGFRSAT